MYAKEKLHFQEKEKLFEILLTSWKRHVEAGYSVME